MAGQSECLFRSSRVISGCFKCLADIEKLFLGRIEEYSSTKKALVFREGLYPNYRCGEHGLSKSLELGYRENECNRRLA
jgi:hypothetical protein